MSDPMSMPEIEDVVSSIRRLVSETGASKEIETQARKEPEKFVLTPALRVEDVPEDVFEDAPEEVREPVSLADVPEDDPQAGVESVGLAEAEPVETVGAEEDSESVLPLGEPIDVGVEDQANAPVEWEDADDDAADMGTPDAGPVAETLDQVADVPETPVFKRSSLEDRIAELEAAIGAQADDFEPDGSEETGTAPHTATILSLSRSAGGTRFDGRHDAAPGDRFGGQPQDTSQYDADFDDFDDPLETEDPLDLQDDDALLDENALRELVSDIVREELQGELGERITRNVRRLVRREVQRALTLRDLD